MIGYSHQESGSSHRKDDWLTLQGKRIEVSDKRTANSLVASHLISRN
jgi:hypothetical protein